MLPNAKYVVGVCLDPNTKRFKRTLIYHDTDTIKIMQISGEISFVKPQNDT